MKINFILVTLNPNPEADGVLTVNLGMDKGVACVSYDAQGNLCSGWRYGLEHTDLPQHISLIDHRQSK